MRKLRVAVVALFVLSVIVLAGYIVYDRLTKDVTPPVMSCDADSISVSVEADDKELLKGVKATDNKDGNLTDAIRVASLSRFTDEKGKRTITYVVFDKANNAAQLSREIQYTDYTSPQILLSEPLRFDLKDLDKLNLEEHMSVKDCIDGDISGKIRVSLDNNTYISEAGTYTATAQVSNSAGDTCTVPLEITVVDSSDGTESRKYYPMLSQYIAYTKVGQKLDAASYLEGLMQGDSEYPFGESGLVDASAGDVSVSDGVDYSKAGTYAITYTYTSGSGVTAVTKLTVVVEE